MEYRFTTIDEALPALAREVLAGEEIGSRNGRTMEILFPHIVITDPRQRYVTNILRKASLPAQIAETMWLLAGRNEVEFLTHYLPRAAEFSDDGVTWKAAYGQRLRQWESRDFKGDIIHVDQLAWVVELLRKSPGTRRAVMAIYDPAIDSEDSKDVPCNNWIQFISRLGKLHMHVTIRSNDLMWGFSGINAFEWSSLLEIVAGLTGLGVGELHFSTTSLHLYDRHWSKARQIGDAGAPGRFGIQSPFFDWGTNPLGSTDSLDNLVQSWLIIEDEIRRTREYSERIQCLINAFPEPLFRSWLRVIAFYWTGQEETLSSLRGTAIYHAALNSPKVPGLMSSEDPAITALFEIKTANREDSFIAYVAALHEAKNFSYGDSWRRRGEPGILANIARKVDRLGKSDGLESSADTAIDLLVYLVKYHLWLTADAGECDNAGTVAKYLRALPRVGDEDGRFQAAVEESLRQNFERLEKYDFTSSRLGAVSTMVDMAAPLARYLWTEQEFHRA